MSFDDLQAIWNSQQLSDSSLDHDALLKTIKDRYYSFRRVANVTEIVMTLTLLFVAAMFLRDPLLQGHDRVLILPGIACLIAASFVWKRRMDRRKREINYDESLLGLIEKSIDGIDDRIARMGGFLWWFVFPNVVGLCIALFIVDDTKRYLLYSIFIPAFCACMVLAYWQIRREIRTTLLPERERLDELRTQLRTGGKSELN